MTEQTGAPEISRRTLAAAFALGFAFSAIMILAYAHGEVDRMTSGDGLFFRYVATHLGADKGTVSPIVAAKGPAMRYGRIGLPAAIWLLSGGRPHLMRYAQPMIMALSGGASAAAAFTLIRKRGPPVGLAPFAAVGFTLSIAGGYGEGLAIPLALWAAVAATKERWLAASALLAAAMLTRENAALILVGLLVWCMVKRSWRSTAILACSIAPVVAWHLIVAARFGSLPLADPYTKTGSMVLRTPFLALLRGFTQYGGGAAITAGIHLALWIVAFLMARRSTIGWLAVAAGLQLAFIPLLNWLYLGDTFRLFSFLEVFTVLAVAAASPLRHDAARR